MSMETSRMPPAIIPAVNNYLVNTNQTTTTITTSGSPTSSPPSSYVRAPSRKSMYSPGNSSVRPSITKPLSFTTPIPAAANLTNIGNTIRRLTIRNPRRASQVAGCICHLGEKDKIGICNGCDKRIGPYVVIKKIGEGSFSKVQLAYHVITKKKYALKLVNKQHVKNLQEVATQISNEVNLLNEITGDAINFFVKMEESFETENLFCIVMEYCGGGDLFSRVSSSPIVNGVNCLREDDAREYFVQMVLAVKILHSVGICHRDLKLENFLLDGNNRLKVADFGLSKKFLMTEENVDLMSTYCGTTDYAAPEVLRNQPYDGRFTDIWSLGVVLFAMVSGCFPFKNVNNQMNAIFGFAPSMSTEVKDLISMVLVANPKNRMSLDKILAHPWCAKAKFLSNYSNLNTLTTFVTPATASQPNSLPNSPLSSPPMSPSISPAPSKNNFASTASSEKSQTNNNNNNNRKYPLSPTVSPRGTANLSASSGNSPFTSSSTASTDSSSSSSSSSSRPRSVSTPLPVVATQAVTSPASLSPPPSPPSTTPPHHNSFSGGRPSQNGSATNGNNSGTLNKNLSTAFANFSSFVTSTHTTTQKFFHQRFKSEGSEVNA